MKQNEKKTKVKSIFVLLFSCFLAKVNVSHWIVAECMRVRMVNQHNYDSSQMSKRCTQRVLGRLLSKTNMATSDACNQLAAAKVFDQTVRRTHKSQRASLVLWFVVDKCSKALKSTRTRKTCIDRNTNTQMKLHWFRESWTNNKTKWYTYDAGRGDDRTAAERKHISQNVSFDCQQKLFFGAVHRWIVFRPPKVAVLARYDPLIFATIQTMNVSLWCENFDKNKKKMIKK